MSVRELVIVSGKGGTGKTSLAACFAVLAERAVIADCDVDASDLHLLLSPTVEKREEFRSGHEAVIDRESCDRCGACLSLCRFDALRYSPDGSGGFVYSVDSLACEGCGVCVRFCPRGAIALVDRIAGETFVSDTRCGPMVHARLGVARENSGKLVAEVRQRARRLAEREGRESIIVDGPPGIGCPVISSLSGTTSALVVTEPTVSGEHDLVRVLDLASHFRVPTFVCVNKWDLNPEITSRIEGAASGRGARIAGRVRYDRSVTTAQTRGFSAVEWGGPSAGDIRDVWKAVDQATGGKNGTHE